MSNRTGLLGNQMALEADADRMETARAYEERLVSGAEGVLDQATDDIALMEACARILARATKGAATPLHRRMLLNYAFHRANTIGEG